MLTVPYLSIAVGLTGIGWLLAAVMAKRVQRTLAEFRVNYVRGMTTIFTCGWLTFLAAFAIGVSEIFLLLSMFAMTVGMLGLWFMMDVRILYYDAMSDDYLGSVSTLFRE